MLHYALTWLAFSWLVDHVDLLLVFSALNVHFVGVWPIFLTLNVRHRISFVHFWLGILVIVATFNFWHGIVFPHVWLYIMVIVAKLYLRIPCKRCIRFVDLGWVRFNVDLRLIHSWISRIFPLFLWQLSLAENCVWFVHEAYWLSLLCANLWNETSLMSQVTLTNKVLSVFTVITVISFAKLSRYFQKLILLRIVSDLTVFGILPSCSLHTIKESFISLEIIWPLTWSEMGVISLYVFLLSTFGESVLIWLPFKRCIRHKQFLLLRTGNWSVFVT